MRYFLIVLWLMVWGGMYSDFSHVISPELLPGPVDPIHKIRALLPILAGSIAFLMILASLRIEKFEEGRSTLSRGPIWWITLYGLIGTFFFFLSPKPPVALYWAATFLSVPLVTWAIINQAKEDEKARLLIHINWAIVLLLLLFFLLGPLWPILQGTPNTRIYELPFGLGTQTANGIGRVSGVAGLVALSRFRQTFLIKRLFWLIVFGSSMTTLALSESRAAILGFAFGALVLLLISRKHWWLAIGGPGVAYLLYLSWFEWRFKGDMENAFLMSGREYTWDRVLETSLQSPLLGFGFHADRLLIEGEHVHMAYLHALIQGGILGSILFLGAILGVWIIIIRHDLFRKVPKISGTDNLLLVESIAVLTFLTVRSFFESTAAFYGVDLLLFVPIIAYIQLWIQKNPQQKEPLR